MTRSTAALAARGLSVGYRDHVVIDGLDLSIAAGRNRAVRTERLRQEHAAARSRACSPHVPAMSKSTASRSRRFAVARCAR